MVPIIWALLACVAGLFRSRASLCLEHLALRHQLGLSAISATTASPVDRSGALQAPVSAVVGLARLAFVQPHTVIAWQRQRFRDHWQCLSQRGMPGRPSIAKEVRELIQVMAGKSHGVRLGSSRAAQAGH